MTLEYEEYWSEKRAAKVKSVRHFSGKSYRIYTVLYKSQSAAKKDAANLRKKGRFVRIAGPYGPKRNWYFIYTRYKKPPPKRPKPQKSELSIYDFLFGK